MTIELKRLHYSEWGVDGQLFIADKHVADTCEHPSKYLPPGTYPITMKHMPLMRGNGPFLNTNGKICVGIHRCEGCVIKSTETFMPIYFRIWKALKRGLPVNLHIGV